MDNERLVLLTIIDQLHRLCYAGLAGPRAVNKLDIQSRSIYWTFILNILELIYHVFVCGVELKRTSRRCL